MTTVERCDHPTQTEEYPVTRIVLRGPDRRVTTRLAPRVALPVCELCIRTRDPWERDFDCGYSSSWRWLACLLSPPSARYRARVWVPSQNGCSRERPHRQSATVRRPGSISLPC